MEPPPRGLRRSDLPGAVWPPISLGANAALAALVSQLEVTERFSAETVERMQCRQLGLVAAHHRAHTPSFAARMRAAGLAGQAFDSLAQLRRLPPIGRRDIQEAGEGFFSTLLPEAHRPVTELRTSGSTGEPVTVRKTQVVSLLWNAMTLRDLMWHGGDFSGRMTAIRSHIAAYCEHESWGSPIDGLYACGTSQAIPIETDIREQLRLMRRFGTEVLAVFPSNLKALAELWEAEGFEPKSLRRIRTLNETVSEELRAQVSRLTGVAIEDTYSSVEGGLIAAQCPQSGLYHIMAEALIVELIDAQGEPCSEGECGRVIVTDLHNLATPLIRYEIGDYAEVGGSCPCGRGLPTLRRILGRERNLVILPDGRRHWPRLAAMSLAFGKAVPLRQFQLIQHNRTAIEFRAVVHRPMTPTEEAAVIQAVQTTLGYPFDVDMVFFESKLPLGANGKFEDFMCRLPAEETRAQAGSR